MTTQPDAEEMRLREHLRDLGVSYTPVPPGEDWWFALYSDQEQDSAPRKARTVRPDADESEEDPEEWEEIADPGDSATIEKRNTLPRAVRQAAARVTQRPTAYAQGLERRTRWTLSTAAGAGLGWCFGLEQVCQNSLADVQASTGSQVASVLLGVAMVCIGGVTAHRTRGWWPPLAWVCRAPLSSALLALLLFAPGAVS